MRIIFFILLLSLPAFAAEWTTYSNPRFGVSIDVPPRFVNDVAEPENGDGLTYHSVDGNTELLVWGNNLVDGDFAADGKSRLQGEKDEGWDVSYQKQSGNAWNVFSGSKGGRIMYARSIASCQGTQALHFRIEYPEAQKKDYDPVVKRLGKSLKAGAPSDCP
jgi:hypothetical protein